ncbi:cytochrome c family protein [Novosphingobium sp.]|uniref:c-type cytochrome n=1 Tax=Novosphingobium sp. TaxID=1874826 RepID=UPI0035B271D6
MKLSLIVPAALILSLGGAAALAAGPAADPVKGKAVFARCAVCHDLNTGANRIGPSLKGVIGRKAGTAAGYAYSPAMKKKAVTWNAATLSAYLAAPTTYVPGNKMAMAPMANPQDRANLIAYLQQAAK